MIEFLQSQFGFSVALIMSLFGMLLGVVAYAILLERKVSAWIQDRIGPNRVGPVGLFQPIADGVKFFLKEDIIQTNVDKPIFILAPAFAFLVAGVGFAVIPWAGYVDIGGPEPLAVQVASVDVGLLYILAVGSLSVYGVVLGGWASNNKFSFYGGMRAAAQMLSYEIPMGLAILVVVLSTGQIRLENIVGGETGQIATAWQLLLHPLAFIILLVTAFAETNRAPFDLAEAEQELIGGYQTEYSSMKMALFYLGEYFHIITVCAFITVLFLGGWELFPFSDHLGLAWLNHSTSPVAAALRFGIMMGKVILLVFFFMWVRWTLPRFRFDQLMQLAWKGLVPASILLVVWTGLLVYWGKQFTIWAPIGDIVIFVGAMAWVALAKTPLTGRQSNMEPIEAWTPRRGEMKGGMTAR